MGLSNTQYRDIMYKYDQLRLKNKRLVASRYEKLFENFPELKEIQNKIINLSTNQARMELLNPDQKLDEETYRAKKEALVAQKRDLLIKNGYPADFLSPIYTCKDCKDTGYIDNKPCHCLKQYEITALYKNSNLADILEKENFGTFNENFYDNKHIVENLSLTARENIIRIKDVCLDFVKHFDNAYDNLIFYGETGVGKTFLTHCIAKELLDTSHTVVYLTSLQLFDILEKNKFYKTDEYSNNEQISYILNCELLIIDDLGTELTNGFTTSQLYYFIEERHMNQKSTIISTNLSFHELRERYSERIFSRFTGYYNFYMIAGDDIRIKIAIS